MLTTQEIQNLIAIVSTHPTPEGVGSQVGQVKVQLINKLSTILSEQDKEQNGTKSNEATK